eukprot:TRINITY_DN45392_c0_g1_i1.p1 TRINITY_DN45392_c0_g1~~TRINITY_DN45392_c0_g1_i1.p1  ORF type:complete len:259 (+),score=103.60 TRINITY_DN45392_c0_g1_i1:192-968(+)
MKKDDEERSIVFEGDVTGTLHDEWVADPEPERQCCVRYGLVIVNVTLLAAAVVLVIVGMIAKKSSISQLCPQCRDVSEAAAILGMIFLVSSVIGFFALMKRHVGVLVAYVIITALLMFGVVGITLAGVILTARGVDLSSEWRESVDGNNHLICSVQRTYSCSGWDLCCGAENTPVPATDSNMTDGTPTCVWNPKYCLSRCGDSNLMTDSCENSVQKWLRTLLVPFVLGMLVVLGLMLFGGYRSKQLRRKVRNSSVIQA